MREKKVLFIATIAKHILRFHLPYLKWFQERGFETHVASDGSEEIPFCNVKHAVPIKRSPFSPANFKANRILKQIIEKNNFDVIHGHTPMGGVLARTASIKARKKGTKVLYTTHGFHFFKGAPITNWALYYPIEKFLSKYTDAIITINHEDYQLLFERKFKSPGKYLINGVGVKEERFVPVTSSEKSRLRREYGYPDDQLILIYVAEFIHRKNHRFIIDATPELSKRIPNLKILFAGRGILFDKMRDYANSMHLLRIIEFLGFRSDVEKLMAFSDIGISSSRQEGLGLNLAEEMLIGLPVVASQDRGHRELVKYNYNGFLFKQNDKKQFIEYIERLAKDAALRSYFSENSKIIARNYTLSEAISEMGKIYNIYID